MIEEIIKLYNGDKVNACMENGRLNIFVSRGGAVYNGSLKDGQLSGLKVFGYCDEIIPFSGGYAERRAHSVNIKY